MAAALIFLLAGMAGGAFSGQAFGADWAVSKTVDGTASETADGSDSAAWNAQFGSKNLEKIQQFLDEREELEGLSFSRLMEALLKGEYAQAGRLLLTAGKKGVFSEIRASSGFLLQTLLIAVSGAVFSALASVFPGSRISENGFFITYLLAAACLLTGCLSGMELAERAAGTILEFLEVLLPAFFLSVAFSGGSIQAAGFYGGLAAAVAAADFLISFFFLPLVKCFLCLNLAGNLQKPPVLGRLTAGLAKGISWGAKTLAGLFLGFQFIQTLILPYADRVKTTALGRLTGLIPGIGPGVQAAVQAALGTAVLVKNACGSAAVIVLLLLAAGPIASLGILYLIHQLAAALMEPVCDRRMTACVAGVGHAYRLLCEILAVMVVLFSISVGIVCSAGQNQGL